MTAAPILQPFGHKSSSAQFLGCFAIGDSPRGRASGVYRVSGAGWYAKAYGELYGPFLAGDEALECLAYLEQRGPRGAMLLMKWASKALWMLAKILSVLFCCAVAWTMLAVF